LQTLLNYDLDKAEDVPIHHWLIFQLDRDEIIKKSATSIT